MNKLQDSLLSDLYLEEDLRDEKYFCDMCGEDPCECDIDLLEDMINEVDLELTQVMKGNIGIDQNLYYDETIGD